MTVIKSHYIKTVLKTFLLLPLLAIMSSCGSPRYVSTLVGGEYNADKDVTEYFVIPFGQVSLPGKWEKDNYVSNSRHQFFHNQDSVIIAIAFTNSSGYEFNSKGLLKGYDFVKAYYEWESEYFSSLGLEAKIIESDQSKAYIVWRVYGQDFDTYFLIGERNGRVSNYSVNATYKWTVDEKVQFLKGIYLD